MNPNMEGSSSIINKKIAIDLFEDSWSGERIKISHLVEDRGKSGAGSTRNEELKKKRKVEDQNDMEGHFRLTRTKQIG